MAGKSFAHVVSALVFHAGIIPYILQKINCKCRINAITTPENIRTPLRKVCENDTIPMLDSSVAEVCQRVSASQAACPVSIAEEGFCNYLRGETP